MKLVIKENYTHKKRLETIYTAYHTLGMELYMLCQSSAKIKADMKEKLTEEICTEYARQTIEPVVKNFVSGQLDFQLNHKNVKELAVVIKKMSPKEYEELLDGIDKIEERWIQKQEMSDEASR